MEIGKGNTPVSSVRKIDLLQQKLFKQYPTMSLSIVLDQVLVDGLLLGGKNGFGYHRSLFQRKNEEGCPNQPLPTEGLEIHPSTRNYYRE